MMLPMKDPLLRLQQWGRGLLLFPRCSGGRFFLWAGFFISAALLTMCLVLVLPLAVPPPLEQSPLFLDRRGGYLAEDLQGEGNLGFWNVTSGESPYLVEALLAIEDRRFWRHPGVDTRSLCRSLLSTLKGRRQGGSTLAMQVVRLSHPGERTLFRKFREMGAALLDTRLFGRDWILERYLTTVPQGNRISGVACAARRYFRKPVADLSLAEASLLAAIPQAPGRMNPFDVQGFERARERAFLVLHLVEEGRAFDAEVCEAARTELAGMARPRRPARPLDSLHFIERLFELPRGTESGRAQLSSLDPDIQYRASSLVRRAVEENADNCSGNAAMIVSDAKTGEILAWAGSARYFDQERSGSIDYCVTPRSSGSSLKPFLYAQGLDAGLFTPASILADLPFTVLSSGGEYRVENFDTDYLGPMLYSRALANSRNIPAVRVLEALGPDRFHSLCRSLGLARGSRDSSWYGYGIAIGGLEVTLRDLVSSWLCLLNDGQERPLSFLRSSSRPSSPPAASRRLFSASSAREILLALSDSEARTPSFPRLGPLEYSWPVAVKTGTSQGYRDAWAVAASRSYVVGMWMGNPDNSTMNRIAGSLASVYVHQMMDSLHPLQQEGIDEELFAKPEGSLAVWLCPLSGQRAGEDCPNRVREYFQPGKEPRASCTVHRTLAVDSKTGLLADEYTPQERVALRSFTVLGPEYAYWGSLRGYGAPPTTTSAPASIAILSPKPSSRYLLDADIPTRFQTVQLRASVSPSSDTVSWYVDGTLYRKSTYPHTLRWPLVEGTHSIEAVSSDGKTRSQKVEIDVR